MPGATRRTSSRPGGSASLTPGRRVASGHSPPTSQRWTPKRLRRLRWPHWRGRWPHRESDMELRHLRYFIAIAEERSFTRAAERLWVAQPGLSTQIRRLETELGFKLFVRHTRGADLTRAGEFFLERARVALAAADAAEATGRDLEAGQIGSLRLGIASGARWRPISDVLRRFSDER